MNIRFMNLSMKKKSDRKAYEVAFSKVLKSGMFIMGKEVEEFEKQITEYTKSPYCLGVASGTDALILALKAYDISEGDEVIIPDMSFIATANAVTQVGAKVIFCDVGDDFNIDTKRITALITDKTKAIIPVHYAGRIADMKSIKKIAKEHKLLVIEDASQAFGATLHGEMAGTLGDIACFSLNPMKPLGALGEAGIITTPSQKIYKKLKALRYNGLNDKKECIYKSFNAKIDTLQAAFLTLKLQEFDKTMKKRESIAKYYDKYLPSSLIKPKRNKNQKDAFFTYTILVKESLREKLKNHLLENGIEVKVNHPSMHMEPAYKSKNSKSLKNSLKLSKQKLALPCHEKLKLSEIKQIVKTLTKFYDAL